MRAAIHNETGLVVNVIVLPDDGPSTYDPDDGLTLVELEDDVCVGPGWQLVDDEWLAPVTSTPPPPTLEELQARAVALAEQAAQIQAQIEQLLEEQE